jgi:hypothetical protein
MISKNDTSIIGVRLMPGDFDSLRGATRITT